MFLASIVTINGISSQAFVTQAQAQRWLIECVSTVIHSYFTSPNHCRSWLVRDRLLSPYLTNNGDASILDLDQVCDHISNGSLLLEPFLDRLTQYTTTPPVWRIQETELQGTTTSRRALESRRVQYSEQERMQDSIKQIKAKARRRTVSSLSSVA
jgi:hypothetical protein